MRNLPDIETISVNSHFNAWPQDRQTGTVKFKGYSKTYKFIYWRGYKNRIGGGLIGTQPHLDGRVVLLDQLVLKELLQMDAMREQGPVNHRSRHAAHQYAAKLSRKETRDWGRWTITDPSLIVEGKVVYRTEFVPYGRG